MAIRRMAVLCLFSLIFRNSPKQLGMTLPTKVPSDSLGRIGSLKRTSDKSLFPMALGSCGHRITHQLCPINMNGRSILSVTSDMVSQEFMSPELKINESGYETGSVAQSLWRKTSQVSLSR